jgi:hypothetical protein
VCVGGGGGGGGGGGELQRSGEHIPSINSSIFIYIIIVAIKVGTF